MAASAKPYRRRYLRSPREPAPLTPGMLSLLSAVERLGLASLPQLARLCGRSPKGSRRLLRPLFDMGLVDVLPLSRAALAGPNLPNDPELLYGSAPNLYRLTRAGAAVLQELGLAGETPLARASAPRTSFFIAHRLAVGDVRVWLELCARSPGEALERWMDGPEAAIRLCEGRSARKVLPDAWFVYRISCSRPDRVSGSPAVRFHGRR